MRVTQFLMALLFLVIVTACHSGNKNVQEKEKIEQAKVVQATINISGMHCDGCVASIERGLNQLDGIEEMKVSLKDSNAIVTFDTSKLDIGKIKKAIEERGYSIKE